MNHSPISSFRFVIAHAFANPLLHQYGYKYILDTNALSRRPCILNELRLMDVLGKVFLLSFKDGLAVAPVSL